MLSGGEWLTWHPASTGRQRCRLAPLATRAIAHPKHQAKLALGANRDNVRRRNDPHVRRAGLVAARARRSADRALAPNLDADFANDIARVAHVGRIARGRAIIRC
eukprot:scaffold248419_cov28-Tisochrysis_lutea.AAC.8